MATTHTPFFDRFPKVQYDINRKLYPTYDTATNIFMRIGIIKEVLNNISSYYVLELEDGDTPELLAEKVYGDSGAGWMIIYANNIMDPQYDWPLTYDAFQKYIIGKYGSIELAKTTAHHYEKIVERYDSETGVTTVDKFWINGEKLTQNSPEQPYDYYFPYASTLEQTVDSELYRVDMSGEGALTVDIDTEATAISRTQTVNTYNVSGKTIQETIYGREVDCLTYEEELNDSRKTIKVIKSEYYSQIMKEFNDMTNFQVPYIRRLI